MYPIFDELREPEAEHLHCFQRIMVEFSTEDAEQED